MNENRSYFKSFMKSGLLVFTLFITTLIMTLIYSNYQFKILSKFMHIDHLGTYIGVALILGAIIGFAYLLLNLKVKHLTLADAIYLALIITGLIFTACSIFFIGSFNTRRILFCTLTIGFGFILFIARVICFKHISQIAEKEKSYGKFRAYFAKLIDKYSLFSIALCAAITVCIVYLVFDIKFSRELKGDNYLIFACICLVPAFLYALKASFDKHVNLLDAFLLSGIISLPVILVQILVSDYSKSRVLIWVMLVVLFALFYGMRFVRFDKNATDREFGIKNGKKLIGYYEGIFAKFDAILAVAIGAIIALVVLTLLKGQAINDYLLHQDLLHIQPKSLPVIAVLATTLVALAFFAGLPLIGIKLKRHFVGDFTLAICVSFAIFGLLTLPVYPSPLYFYLLIIFTVYTFIISIVRVDMVRKSA